jgi:hypothetical protein
MDDQSHHEQLYPFCRAKRRSIERNAIEFLKCVAAVASFVASFVASAVDHDCQRDDSRDCGSEGRRDGSGMVVFVLIPINSSLSNSAARMGQSNFSDQRCNVS